MILVYLKKHLESVVNGPISEASSAEFAAIKKEIASVRTGKKNFGWLDRELNGFLQGT